MSHTASSCSAARERRRSLACSQRSRKEKAGAHVFIALHLEGQLQHRSTRRQPAAAAAAAVAGLWWPCMRLRSAQSGQGGLALRHTIERWFESPAGQEGWHFSCGRGCARDDCGKAGPLSVERLKMDLPFVNVSCVQTSTPRSAGPLNAIGRSGSPARHTFGWLLAFFVCAQRSAGRLVADLHVFEALDLLLPVLDPPDMLLPLRKLVRPLVLERSCVSLQLLQQRFSTAAVSRDSAYSCSMGFSTGFAAVSHESA